MKGMAYFEHVACIYLIYMILPIEYLRLGIFEVLKNDYKRWIETTKTEQKPKLAGHLLLNSEAVWDMEERN